MRLEEACLKLTCLSVSYTFSITNLSKLPQNLQINYGKNIAIYYTSLRFGKKYQYAMQLG